MSHHAAFNEITVRQGQQQHSSEATYPEKRMETHTMHLLVQDLKKSQSTTDNSS
jgi:hypothetical protein